jgi:hypothetical protein
MVVASPKQKAAKSKSGQVRHPTEQEVLKLAEVRLQWARAFQIIAFFFGLSILALAAEPLAHAIAGTKTSFSLSATLSASIALGAATALTGTGFAVQSGRARHHKKRGRDLEKRVEELQDRLNKEISGNNIPAQGAVSP